MFRLLGLMRSAALPAGARRGGDDHGDQPGWVSEVTNNTC